MKNIYCIWLATFSDHHVINDYVTKFDELDISRFNVINSANEHYWTFLVECEEEKFKKLHEWAVSKLGTSASFVVTFQVDPTHHYFNSALGQQLYAHPKSNS